METLRLIIVHSACCGPHFQANFAESIGDDLRF